MKRRKAAPLDMSYYEDDGAWMRPKTTDPRFLTLEKIKVLAAKLPKRPDWDGIVLSLEESWSLKVLASQATPVGTLGRIELRTSKAVPVGLAVLTDGGKFVRVVRLAP
jgi:hypothetical protein